MAESHRLTPAEIRALRLEKPNQRDRDFATANNITEAQLVAAYVGHGVTPISADLDQVMETAMQLGEVMALTRNESCVHEKVGTYGNYRRGPHAAMIFNGDIDLRFFPSHWKHAFMVEREMGDSLRRSIQVFDAAGDAVHKIFLRDEAHIRDWDAAKARLALPNPSDVLEVTPRVPTQGPKILPEKAEELRRDWARMNDTHQFMRITSNLGMNRLGAYRVAGEPFVRRLANDAVDQALQGAQARGIEIMVFVGNRGCIQIHSGPIETLKAMGPWQNVMDPRFNLHLRLDHIAEVWAVDKPTKQGPAISVEAFDADGMLICQLFGVGGKNSSRPAWDVLVADLNSLEPVEA